MEILMSKIIFHTKGVATFFGIGGTRPPNVPTEKRNHEYMLLICASERSERAPQKHIYFRSQNTCYICIHIYTINAVPFYYL